MELYKKYIREACIESFEEALRAQINGADRVELCADLHLDGLTPKQEDIISCINTLGIPTKVMVRPRAGNFVYNQKDQKEIFQDIERLQKLGVTEIVFGALRLDGLLDLSLIEQVSDAAKTMTITFHKAIDYCNDPIEAINKLKKYSNIKHILTSGQKPTAIEGVPTLLKMKEVCGQDIDIIAAGKVTDHNVELLHQVLQLNSYHGRNIVPLV